MKDRAVGKQKINNKLVLYNWDFTVQYFVESYFVLLNLNVHRLSSDFV